MKIKYRIENKLDLYDRPSQIINVKIEDNDFLPPKYDIYLKSFYEQSNATDVTNATNATNATNVKKYCFIHSCTLTETGTESLDNIISLINSTGLINSLDTVFINNIGLPIENKYNKGK